MADWEGANVAMESSRDKIGYSVFIQRAMASAGISGVLAVLLMVIDVIYMRVTDWPGANSWIWIVGCYFVLPLFAGSLFGYYWSGGHRKTGMIGGALSGGATYVICAALSLLLGAIQIRFRDNFDYRFGFFLEFAILGTLWLLPLGALLGGGSGFIVSNYTLEPRKRDRLGSRKKPSGIIRRKHVSSVEELNQSWLILIIFGSVITVVGLWSGATGIVLFGILVAAIPVILKIQFGRRQKGLQKSVLLAEGIVLYRKREKEKYRGSTGGLGTIIFDLLFYGFYLIKSRVIPKYEHIVGIEFNAERPDGSTEEIRLEKTVPSNLYGRFFEGNTPLVLYSPYDPMNAFLEGEVMFERLRPAEY